MGINKPIAQLFCAAIKLWQELTLRAVLFMHMENIHVKCGADLEQASLGFNKLLLTR